MVTIESRCHVPGIRAQQVIDFLLRCDDAQLEEGRQVKAEVTCAGDVFSLGVVPVAGEAAVDRGAAPADRRRAPAYSPSRSYSRTRSRSRAAGSSPRSWSRKRQRQLRPTVAGTFMRASLPRPRTSWSGTTAVSATEARSVRIMTQLTSAPSV